jgi:hypothetical protein
MPGADTVAHYFLPGWLESQEVRPDGYLQILHRHSGRRASGDPE